MQKCNASSPTYVDFGFIPNWMFNELSAAYYDGQIYVETGNKQIVWAKTHWEMSLI